MAEKTGATILMSHPKLPESIKTPKRTTREALDKVWSKKGWQEAKPVAPEEPEAAEVAVDQQADAKPAKGKKEA